MSPQERAPIAAGIMVLLGLGLVVARAVEHLPTRSGGQVPWVAVGLACAICLGMAVLMLRGRYH